MLVDHEMLCLSRVLLRVGGLQIGREFYGVVAMGFPDIKRAVTLEHLQILGNLSVAIDKFNPLTPRVKSLLILWTEILGNLLSSTLLKCFLFGNCTSFAMLENFSILVLALLRGKV